MTPPPMPEKREHRGPHPNDAKLFNADTRPRLARAVNELSWLLERGYAEKSSLKLVGDRHTLTLRQRIAVMRCACPDTALANRNRKRCDPDELAGQTLDIDGFNVITTVEAALAGGILLLARDHCLRDMASMHGSYRKVRETIPAVALIGEVLEALGVRDACWYLDQPVSNSGRLKTILLETAENHHYRWRVEIVPDPDRVLIHSSAIVATADSMILDRCARWLPLGREVVHRKTADATILDLSAQPLDHEAAGAEI